MQPDAMDRVFSVFVIVLSLVCGAMALRYSYESSYFPRILCVFLACVALSLFLRLRATRMNDYTAPRDEQVPSEQVKGGVIVFTAIAAYLVAIKLVNYEVSTVLFTAGFIWLLGYRNVVVIALVSTGLTALLYGIFFEFLAVTRPDSQFLQ